MRKLGALGLALVMLVSGLGLLGASIAGDKPENKDMHGNATSWANDNGFDKWGYNRGANLFSGLYCNWALQKFIAVNHDDDDTNDIGPAYSTQETQQLIDQALADGIITQSEYNTVKYYNSYGLYEWGSTDLIMKWNDAWSEEPGGWITNHMTDKYTGDDNKEHKWVYFVKIVRVPVDAYLQGDYWYTANGVEIGPTEWGPFAIIESIYNDPYGGFHGAEYISEYSTGFGAYK